MPAPLSLWQKLQSIFYPVSIRKGSSALNPVLELFYFRGRYLLATPDAIYSDGDKYRPLVSAFQSAGLSESLKTVKQVLVLGTGLASAVHILSAKGYAPEFTLVEIDKLVLDWAKEFLPNGVTANAINDDAFRFISRDAHQYDLVIVDIFFGRVVPDGVLERQFLQECRQRLNAGGFLVLNYMEQPSESGDKAKIALEKVFGPVKELSFGINKVYIAPA